jgi:hypothetical protein
MEMPDAKMLPSRLPRVEQKARPPIDQARERGFPIMLHGKSIRFLRLSAIISQYRFTAAFPRKVSGKRDRLATGPRSDRA